MDRNTSIDNITQGVFKSLSARRAWIEMPWGGWGARPPRVSLSARRAWIEIFPVSVPSGAPTVALRKESVDRNFMFPIDVMAVSAVALRKESVDRNMTSQKLLKNY